MFNEFLSSSKETSRLMGDVDSIKIQVGEPMNEVGLEDDITDFSEGVSFEEYDLTTMLNPSQASHSLAPSGT